MLSGHPVITIVIIEVWLSGEGTVVESLPRSHHEVSPSL